jgi:hypothetical protein
LRTLRNRRREFVSDDLPDTPSPAAGPDTLAQRNELAALIATAEGGLSDRDREVLDLVYRHGLSGPELAQARGVGADSAKKMVQRLRDTIERSVGALLIARQVRLGYNRCPQLATLVADWDGVFTILVRKRISRHVDSCANCDEARGRLVSPIALLGASPVLIPAPSWMREPTLDQMQHVSLTGAGTAAASHPTGILSLLTGRVVASVLVLVAVPATAVGVAVGWPAVGGWPATSVQISTSAPATSPQSTSASATNVITPQPNTSTPPSVGLSAPPNSGAGHQRIPPTVQVPPPAPSTTVAQDVPAAPPPTEAAPAPNAPASTAAPQSREPKKPPVQQTPSTTTTVPPPPNCPRIAVQNGPLCGRPTP